MAGLSEEKQIRVTCVDSNKKGVSGLILNDDLVVYQILSRLPAKLLMRFKCVCKTWKTIIEQDPHFMNLHSRLSEARPGLFIVAPVKHDKRSRCRVSLLSLDLNKSGANVESVKRIESSWSTRKFAPRLKLLGPVRGLLCLVDRFADRFAVRICNVSTGAVTPWIDSIVKATVRSHGRHTGCLPECFFGYDGENHKVVFLWRKWRNCPPVCEVLTLDGKGSTSSWRIIDSVTLPEGVYERHICAFSNGSVYWATKDYDDMDYYERLTAFDMGSEQFRFITIPKFTRVVDGLRRHNLQVVDLDGCPAVLRHDRSTIKMWKLHDCRDKESTSSEKDWSEVTIRPPDYLSLLQHIIFVHSIPGKDLLILETYGPTSELPVTDWRNVKRAHFYCYSLKNETFSEFNVQGISFLPDDCVTECATLVESLLSVH
ncbi:Putative F-box protein At2g02030 [Linum grandiflorum]